MVDAIEHRRRLSLVMDDVEGGDQVELRLLRQPDEVEQLEAALKFEKKNANRKGAIAALESALAAKQE